MTEEIKPESNERAEAVLGTPSDNSGGRGPGNVEDMYESWFLDYASYVILDRAVPHIYDGLKPVQRRILHSMNELEDGRYNKAANVIGNTMKYHPHGDMAIEDAMVKMAQKELLIDTQGNWGNTATGDRAAAPRYIEARLTPFAKEILFKDEVTEWQSSYDGRNKEPTILPVKFPLLLVTGVEGIAVGLSTKILPHNFIEVIDQSIAYLEGSEVVLVPDFLNGGIVDARDYNGGRRGGKVKVRAKLEILDNKTIKVAELPYGVTTSSLIDSILSANDKNKIKVKKVEDNTAEHVEILIHLGPGISPYSTMDALYAFTDCEVSISTSCCVIQNDKPYFCTVTDLLTTSVDKTKELLQLEYEIKKDELLDKLHMSNLEALFIEHKIYRKIEQAASWDDVLKVIRKGLKPYEKDFIRELKDDDITKLTEIKIKRISKFDREKAEEAILKLKDQLAFVEDKLADMVVTTIDYFNQLKDTYGAGRERRSQIESFQTVKAKAVAVMNQKVYINRREGFIGTGLKKDEFLVECSDLDEIIAFTKDGQCMVSKVTDKTFFGKNILYAGIFTRGDDKTIYHVIYQDGRGGPSYKKRFAMPSVTRGRQYDLTRGTKGSRLWHFSVNPGGGREVVEVTLKKEAKTRNKIIDVDFEELDIKTRTVKGLLLTKEPIASVEVLKKEAPLEEATKLWFDSKQRRLNTDKKGKSLGEFAGDDKIFTLYKSGSIELSGFGLDTYFDDGILHLAKLKPEIVITCVYFHGEKKDYYVKRFKMDELAVGKREDFIPAESGSKLLILSFNPQPRVAVTFKKGKRGTPDPELIDLAELVQPKGVKAIGNKLSRQAVKTVKLQKS